MCVSVCACCALSVALMSRKYDTHCDENVLNSEFNYVGTRTSFDDMNEETMMTINV